MSRNRRLMKAFKLTRRAGRGHPQYAAALVAQARGDGDQARARQILSKERKELKALLASKDKQWKTIADEIKALKDQFGQKTALGKRRTSFAEAPEGVETELAEAMIEKEPVTIVLSEKGWIRAIKGPSDRYRRPRLQGRRPAEARGQGADHRHAAAVRHQWPVLFARRRQAAGGQGPRRAVPPDDRYRGGGRRGRAVRCTSRAASCSSPRPAATASSCRRTRSSPRRARASRC